MNMNLFTLCIAMCGVMVGLSLGAILSFIDDDCVEKKAGIVWGIYLIIGIIVLTLAIIKVK